MPRKLKHSLLQDNRKAYTQIQLNPVAERDALHTFLPPAILSFM
jgi:hypothetical protein